LLADCLHSVVATAGDLRYEVFVVDNASADSSAEMVARDFPWVHLIRNDQNRGFAFANNQALTFSQGRQVLLLNSDAMRNRGAADDGQFSGRPSGGGRRRRAIAQRGR